MFQGKLIEIHFSETGKISGAKIQTCKIIIVVTLNFQYMGGV